MWSLNIPPYGIWNLAMSHVSANKKKLVARIRRIRGQVEALEKSLDADPDCMAVLTQIAAVRGAAQGLMMEVLDGHLQEHLAEEPDRKKREEEIAGISAMLRSYFK